jgi:hypothetical protein
MIKVRILDCCEFCDGEAYVFVCEDGDSRGNTFDRYRPCSGQAQRPDALHSIQDETLHGIQLPLRLRPTGSSFDRAQDVAQEACQWERGFVE